MSQNMEFLEAQRRWLEMFNQPLTTMRQELRGLIADEKTGD